MKAVLVGGQVLTNVHPPDKCAGEYCCIHYPSNHSMLGWVQKFTGTMWRVSSDGAYYPDPDDPYAPKTPNAIECLNCHDVIVSLSRHDFKHCVCGDVFVDGGSDYRRRGWPNGKRPEESFIEISEWPIRPNQKRN